MFSYNTVLFMLDHESRKVTNSEAFAASIQIQSLSGYARAGFLYWDNLYMTMAVIIIGLDFTTVSTSFSETVVRIVLAFAFGLIAYAFHPTYSGLVRNCIYKLKDLNLDGDSSSAVKRSNLMRFYHND